MGTHPIFESDFDCLTDMGVLFIEYPKSDRYFACKKCDTPIADACNENVAVDHRNRTYLFQKFVNTKQGNSYTKNEIRNIMVRDVWCLKCKGYLGWCNEFYKEKKQQYKEGQLSVVIGSVILRDSRNRKNTVEDISDIVSDFTDASASSSGTDSEDSDGEMQIERLQRRLGANILIERGNVDGGRERVSDIVRLGIMLDQGRSIRALQARLSAARDNNQ